MEKYILTLDFIKHHCIEVIGEWDGDQGGEKEEERADAANEILDHVKEIENLLKEIL